MFDDYLMEDTLDIFNEDYDNSYYEYDSYEEAYNEGYNDAISEIMDNYYIESKPTNSNYNYNRYGSNRSEGVANSKYGNNPNNDKEWKAAISFAKQISPAFRAEKISRQKIVSFYRRWKGKGSPTALKGNKRVQSDLNKLQYNDLYRRSRVDSKDYDGYHYQGERQDPRRAVGNKSSRGTRSAAAQDAKETYDYDGYNQSTRQEEDTWSAASLRRRG